MIRRQIGHDQRDAAISQSGQNCHWIIVGMDRRIDQLELLVHEATGRVVVAHREPGTRKAIVGGRLVQQRYRGARFQPTQVSDLDGGGIRTRGTR